MAGNRSANGKPGSILPVSFNLTEQEYEAIRKLVKEKTGISLGLHKKDLVISRLARRLRELKLDGFRPYIELLRSQQGDAELVNMINRITTNKTDFFREKHHFDSLSATVLPEIFERGEASGHRVLRGWSAGCSSGEEPYSIAITIAEFFKKRPGWDCKILASDLDTTILTKARNGVYGEQSVEPLPRPLLSRYFERLKQGDGQLFRVKPELRKMLTFRKFSLKSAVYPQKVAQDLVL